MPHAGVIAPISTSDEEGMWSVVFPNKIAVEVMVVKPRTRVRVVKERARNGDVPSERRNHAARYLNVCWSRLIWDQRSITPRRFHAETTSDPTVHLSFPLGLLPDPPGSQSAAGIENRIHQAPLSPIARRSENVEPCICLTGTSAKRSRRMPAAYPDAMPCAEIRDVARESAATYALWTGLW